MTDQDATFFDSFRNVVRVVSSSLDVQQVLNNLTETVTDVVGVKGCVIRLLNPKKRTLELAAAHGLSDDYLNKGPVDADQSIAEALTGKPVYVEDATSDPRAQYQDEAKRAGIASILSMPLPIKGHVIGVLRIYTGTPRSFSDKEVEFVEALAEIGALAIENARMYEQLKSDYEEVVSDIYNFVGYRRSI